MVKKMQIRVGRRGKIGRRGDPGGKTEQSRASRRPVAGVQSRSGSSALAEREHSGLQPSVESLVSLRLLGRNSTHFHSHSLSLPFSHLFHLFSPHNTLDRFIFSLAEQLCLRMHCIDSQLLLSSCCCQRALISSLCARLHSTADTRTPPALPAIGSQQRVAATQHFCCLSFGALPLSSAFCSALCTKDNLFSRRVTCAISHSSCHT